jgi:hypothetical protein
VRKQIDADVLGIKVKLSERSTQDVLNLGEFAISKEMNGLRAIRISMILLSQSLEFFIPRTADQCDLANAGCDEFTNLGEVAQGGEGREYYTYIRQCKKPEEAGVSCGNYYTWQGLDNSGHGLPSGLYIYQIKANEFVDSKKMILLK